MIIILTSIDDKAKAEHIAQALVEQKLAVCVQISAQGMSVYQWQGKLCKNKEYYLFIKTDEAHQDKVVVWLEANHPYDTPEIISFNAKASAEYQHWIDYSLK